MANNIHVSPDEFGKVLEKIIKDYGDEAYEITQGAAKKAARSTTSDLKGSAPEGGSYARGWSHKAQKDGVAKYSETVYNRTDAQLTHLLEKPHVTGGGGQYPKNVDYTGTMARIEQEETENFISEVMKKL